jgi:hypothetical protein
MSATKVSASSVTVTEIVTESETVEPAAGLVMVTIGASLGGGVTVFSTVTDTESEPVKDPESVASA